jgi:hypothetical protein
LAAALLGVLAVLASLFLGPAATTAQAAAAPASTASTVRGVAPLFLGPRETRDHLRALARRDAGEQSRLAVATERTATAGQGPTLLTAILGAAVLVVPLVAGFPAVRERSEQVSRRMSGTHRDRAPPALALA